MSLNWDLTNIKNAKELCWVESDEEGKVELNPITDALIWATMFVGIGRITEKTVDEFTMRLMEWEKLMGGILLNPEGKSCMPNYMDVLFHVGLSTNVTEMKPAKWKNKLARVLRESVQRDLNKVKDTRNNIKEVA